MNDTIINKSVPLPFGQVEIIVASSTIFPLCLFGIFANIATMAGVLHSQILKSPLYFLLMSLCVSDLISALISPLSLYRIIWGYDFWYWSGGLCKIYWGIHGTTTVVTVLHILMFSILRFVSVKWPQKFELFTLQRTKIFVTIIWIGCLSVAFAPMLSFFEAVRRDRRNPVVTSQWPSCSLLLNKFKEGLLHAEIVYSTLVYIPTVVITVCSIATSIQILTSRKKREKLLGVKGKRNRGTTKRRRKENKILLQLGLIVCSFLLGYIPRTAYHFYSYSLPRIVGSGNYNWWFAFIEILFLRVSESLNPVFYNLSSKKMRRATFEVLRVAWRKIAPKDDFASESTASKFTSQTLKTTTT